MHAVLTVDVFSKLNAYTVEAEMEGMKEDGQILSALPAAAMALGGVAVELVQSLSDGEIETHETVEIAGELVELTDAFLDAKVSMRTPRARVGVRVARAALVEYGAAIREELELVVDDAATVIVANGAAAPVDPAASQIAAPLGR